MINIERKRQRQHDNFLQLRLMLSTMLILDCVNVYLRLDLMDIMEPTLRAELEAMMPDSEEMPCMRVVAFKAMFEEMQQAESAGTLFQQDSRAFCVKRNQACEVFSSDLEGHPK